MNNTKEKQKNNNQKAILEVVYKEGKRTLKEDFTMKNPPKPPKKK